MTSEAGPVTRRLLELSPVGAGERALAQQVCSACVEGIHIDGAAISALTADVARATLWASDATAQRLEDLQFELNEGACMQAAHSGTPVLVPDILHSTETARWPIFAAAVAEQTSVRALFALPLQWGVTNLGVLDLYRVTPGGLGAAQWRDAISAADLAAVMLLGVRTDPDAGSPTGSSATEWAADWLSQSVGGRAEVHQATGMVLVQLDVTAAEALARMRAHAFAQQRPLVDVARDVIARRLVFTQDMA